MFITFLPVDKWGNTPYGRPQVIEVEEQVVTIGDTEYDDWKVLAPQSFIDKWPSLSPRPYPWVEVSGPARTLVIDDYVNLLQEVNVKQEYIDRACALL